MMNKKGQSINLGLLVGLISVGVIFVIFGIVMSFGAQVVDEVQDDFTADSYAANISSETLKANYTLSKKQNTWALIIGIGVVISLLLGFLGFVALRNM